MRSRVPLCRLARTGASSSRRLWSRAQPSRPRPAAIAVGEVHRTQNRRVEGQHGWIPVCSGINRDEHRITLGPVVAADHAGLKAVEWLNAEVVVRRVLFEKEPRVRQYHRPADKALSAIPAAPVIGWLACGNPDCERSCLTSRPMSRLPTSFACFASLHRGSASTRRTRHQLCGGWC